MHETPKILFIAGDLSGDKHLARVMEEVARAHCDWRQFAVGGAQMRASDATVIGDSRDCGVIGIGPALKLVPRLFKLRHRVLDWCEKERPQLVVLCDWGAFNARLLPSLKTLGIPTLYYFPPASWRKSGARGLSIAPDVTRVATPFSWSALRLQSAGAKADWVGHPILETIRPLAKNSGERTTLRREFGASEDEKLVVLMPGSRALELKFIAPHLSQVVTLLQRRETPKLSTRSENFQAKTRCIVAVPSGATARARNFFDQNVAIVEGRASELLMACDAAVVKSGTSTLEAAVADAPQVVVYDAPSVLQLQWRLMGGAKKTPFVAMPNIIAERAMVKELLGPDCRAEKIVEELSSLLYDDRKSRKMRENYLEIRCALGSDLKMSASQRIAQIIEEMMPKNQA